MFQVDGYAGYNRLLAPDRVGPDFRLALCWAYARRKLIEITRTGPASGPVPLSFRPKRSFRMRQGFSIPVLSDVAVDCRIR